MGRLANQFKTKISLAAAGNLDEANAELWKTAFIEIEPLTVKALPELSKLGVSKEQDNLNEDQLASLLPLLKKSFVGGMVALNGELVPAEADDIEDLPLEVMNDVIAAALGKPDPKS